MAASRFPLELGHGVPSGGLVKQGIVDVPIDGGVWYIAESSGGALDFRFAAGALAGATFLTADWFLAGDQSAVFVLVLQEGDAGPKFRFTFGFLNQCAARMRMPLEAVTQNRWRYPREGAWLKPLCGGDRVDLSKVDRMQIRLERKGSSPVYFCVTQVLATDGEPALLANPALPHGPLLDELGQNALRSWPGKTASVEELIRSLHAQREAAPAHRWPVGFSRWGGWLERRVDTEGRGYFRTYHDGNRWWLVDPEGYLFWSTGMDCVTFSIESAYDGLETALTWLPDRGEGAFAAAYGQYEVSIFNYLRANFIRAFGPEDDASAWSEIVLSQLREAGFNTVANWSDWRIAAERVPYVRPLRGDGLRGLPNVYRDFPDVFHPDFEVAADEFAAQLRDTVEDPALIGYFLMNEPTWGFASEPPAVGMLFNTPECYGRQALSEYLREKYGSEAGLADAWGSGVTFAAVAAGHWSRAITAEAVADLTAFSEKMVVRYFGVLSAACRRVDPNHLNLGIRYYTVPPEWAVRGMCVFDVFSMNCYKRRVTAAEMAQIHELLGMPIMVGEWHFGALDVGLPASGIGHVPDQTARGQAFRVYLEDAAAKPWCVGVHYFQLYDQSAIGRFDGENYNIGFVDVCNRPYAPLVTAARASHERLYQVAAGEVEPYDEEPEYLPLLFI